MGSNNTWSDEKPVHTVHIKSFKMGRHEVTQRLWTRVMGNNPSKFKGDNLPVEQVSWYEVKRFIEKLNKLTGKQFRLPTEAEWEYAARSGTTTNFSWGDRKSSFRNYGWFGENSNDKTHPVMQKKPNNVGLFDTHGNVWEWTQDCWNGSYKGAPSDGSAWLAGKCGKRVVRGGGFVNFMKNDLKEVKGRSAYRATEKKSSSKPYIGIRLAHD